MFTAANVRGGLLRQKVTVGPLVNAWIFYGRLDYLEFLCEYFICGRDYDLLDI